MRRGRGSITKTGDKRWLVQVSIKGGGRITRRISGTRRAAEDLLRELLEQAEIEASRQDCPTVAEFFENYFIPRCKSKGLAPTTLDGYERVYKNHIAPVFADTKVCDVGSGQVSALLGSLSYGSARHVKSALSSIFSLAEELELVEVSVMRRKYTLPAKTEENRKRRHDPTVLSWGQMEAIASACAGESWEPAFLMMAFGGMRRSEAVGVQPWDIEQRIEQDGSVWAVVRLARTVTLVNGEIVINTRMKTEESQREVVIAPPWSARLLELKEQAMSLGHTWMCQDGDGVANPDNLSSRYDKWFATRPYRRVPMTNLRNSYTTAMIAAGVDSALVAKMTGHKSMDVTYRHYLRPTTQDIVGALKQTDAK